MMVPRSLVPCLLALCGGLAGCAPATAPEDALYYRAPTGSGVSSVATALTPAEVGKVLRAAGLGQVRTDAGSVTLVSSDPRLVDCGTFVQVSMGNRAEFPANAPLAVFMEGFPSPGLVERGVETRSTVRLTRMADGSGYAIAETHAVTRRYQVIESGVRSASRVAFDQGSEGTFPNGTMCRSTGLVAGLLD